MTESSRVEGALKRVAPGSVFEVTPAGLSEAMMAGKTLAAEVLRLREKLASITAYAKVLADKENRIADGNLTRAEAAEARCAELARESETRQRGWESCAREMNEEKSARVQTESRCADLEGNIQRQVQIIVDLESRLSALTAPVNGERLQRALEWAENRCSPHLLAEELARALRQTRAALADTDRVLENWMDLAIKNAEERVAALSRLASAEDAVKLISEGGPFFGTEPVRIAKEYLAAHDAQTGEGK